jgi:hypothetical protein
VSDGWDTLRSVDPVNRQVGAPLVVNGTGGGPAGPGAMVSTGGAIWVAATYAHGVAEINPSLAQTTQLVPLPGIPTALASTSNSVWVASNPGGIVSRIDSASGRVTKRIRLGRRIGALTVSGGTLIAATGPSQASQRATGDIAYDANGSIVVVHADGGARHVVTHGSVLSAYPPGLRPQDEASARTRSRPAIAPFATIAGSTPLVKRPAVDGPRRLLASP